MRPWHLLALALAISIGVLAWRETTRRGLEERLKTLDLFCFATKEAMRMDWRAFESGDPKQQEEALGRFYEGQHIHHNSTSILMCVEPLPELELACWLNKDWKCLAALARKIHGSLGQ
jgi:hypothetical protein